MTRQAWRRAPRGLRDAARRAMEDGWVLEITGSGHIAWKSPRGVLVVSASTPGHGSSNRNAISQLRRAGLDLPRRGQKRGR